MTVPSDVGSLNLNEQKTGLSEESKAQSQKQGVAVVHEDTEHKGKEENEGSSIQKESALKQAASSHQQQASTNHSNGINSYPKREFSSKKRNFSQNNRYNNNYNPRRTNHPNRYYSNNNLSRYHNSTDGNTDNIPSNYPYFYYYPPPDMYYQHMPLQQQQQQYSTHSSQSTPAARRSYSDNTNFRAYKNEQKDSTKATELGSEDDDDSDTRDDDDLEIIVHDESSTNNHYQTKKSSSSSPNDANKPFDLKRQLEYYFSRQNLVNDTYLVSQMDEDLYVPISVIANFKRVREHTNGDVDLILKALKELPTVTVDESGTKVKPNASLQPKRNTVIFRDVPECTEEEMKQLLKDLDSPMVQSMKRDFGNMWYFTFETEKDALKLLMLVRGKDFKDQPIAARMKSEPVIRVQTRTNNQPDMPPISTFDESTSPNHQLPFTLPMNNNHYPYNQFTYQQGPPHKRHFSPRRQQYQPSYPRYDNTSHFSNRTYERGGYPNRSKFSPMPYEGFKNPSPRAKYNNNNNYNPKYLPRDDTQQEQLEQQEQSSSSSSPPPPLTNAPHVNTTYPERRPYSPRYANTNNYKYNNNRPYNNKYDNDQRPPFRQPRPADRSSMMTGDNKKENPSLSLSPKEESGYPQMASQPTKEESAQKLSETSTATLAEKEVQQEKPLNKSFKEESKSSASVDQTTIQGQPEIATEKQKSMYKETAQKGNDKTLQNREEVLPKDDEQHVSSSDAIVTKGRGGSSTKPITARRRSSNSTVASNSSTSQMIADSTVDNSNRRKRFGKYSKHKTENNKRQEAEDEEANKRKKQPQPEVDLQPAHFPPLPNQQPSSTNSNPVPSPTAVQTKTMPVSQSRSAADVVKASINKAHSGETITTTASTTATGEKDGNQRDKSSKEQQQQSNVKESTAVSQKAQQVKKDAITILEQKENSMIKKDAEQKASSNQKEKPKGSVINGGASTTPASAPAPVNELKLKASFSWADMLKKK